MSAIAIVKPKDDRAELRRAIAAAAEARQAVSKHEGAIEKAGELLKESKDKLASATAAVGNARAEDAAAFGSDQHRRCTDGSAPRSVAAQLAVSRGHEFERIRWSDKISDQSVVREYRLATDWVRVTKFEASALTQGTGLFSRQRWVDVLVECQQVNEKAPIVTLRLKLEKDAS